METQKFEEHPPPWPESWRLENVSVARSGSGLQLSQRLLSYWCFDCFMAVYTNQNAATSGCKIDAVWKSTGGGKRGTLTNDYCTVLSSRALHLIANLLEEEISLPAYHLPQLPSHAVLRLSGTTRVRAAVPCDADISFNLAASLWRFIFSSSLYQVS